MTVIAAANYEIDRGSSVGLPVRLYDANGNPLVLSSGRLEVDTELAAARLAADNLALPTAPDVLATQMLYDGTTQDLARSAVHSYTGIAGGVTAVALYGLSAAQNSLLPAHVLQATDARSNTYDGLQVNAQKAAFNGTTWDRERSNIEGTLLASAARTSTTSSADQTSYNGERLRLFINVTAIVASPSVVCTVEVKDPISGVYTAILTAAAIIGTGHTILEVWPGASAVANLVANSWVGRVWRVTMTHGDADSITYSVGYSLSK